MAPDIAGHFMLEELAEFRSGDRFADLEIVCRGTVWMTHRLVLALHSEVFLRVCDGPAGQSRRLDLSAFGPEVVDCVVEYLYTRDYTTPSKPTMPVLETTIDTTGPGAPPRLRFGTTPTATSRPISELEVAKVHIDICKFAYKYGIWQLKTLAQDKFEVAIKCWDFGEDGLPPQDLKDLLQLAYQDDRAIHRIRVSTVRAMIERDGLREICFTMQLKDLMAKYPAFAVDITTQLARRLGVRKEDCPKDDNGQAKAPYIYQAKSHCGECKDVFWACIPEKDGTFACPKCGRSQPNHRYALITDEDELVYLSMGKRV